MCFHCSHCKTHVFFIFQIGQRLGVLRIYDAVSQRSPATAEWMALEWLKVYWEPRDVGEAQCLGASNRGKVGC